MFRNEYLGANSRLANDDPRKALYSGENWFLATRQADVPAIRRWFELAKEYWLKNRLECHSSSP